MMITWWSCIGPDMWYSVADIRCSSGSQSPIDLPDPLSNDPPTYDEELGNITYQYHNDIRPMTGVLTSAPGYLSLQSLSRLISITDGPFDGTFDLVKIDFHTPSEHKVAE